MEAQVSLAFELAGTYETPAPCADELTLHKSDLTSGKPIDPQLFQSETQITPKATEIVSKGSKRAL